VLISSLCNSTDTKEKKMTSEAKDAKKSGNNKKTRVCASLRCYNQFPAEHGRMYCGVCEYSQSLDDEEEERECQEVFFKCKSKAACSSSELPIGDRSQILPAESNICRYCNAHAIIQERNNKPSPTNPPGGPALPSEDSKAVKPLTIFAKSLNGRVYTLVLPVLPMESLIVFDVMQAFQASLSKTGEGIPHGLYRMIFAGRQMEAEMELSAFNLQECSTVHVVMALRGS
jgi:hypothetical protein